LLHSWKKLLFPLKQALTSFQGLTVFLSSETSSVRRRAEIVMVC